MPFDPYEILKKYEWNKTEPEVLRGLVEKAIKKGENIRQNLKKFRGLTSDVYKILEREKYISEIKVTEKDHEDFKNIFAIGIDGSFYSVGGVGGIWQAPISAARIIFENGIKSIPKVDVEAGIEEIDERKDPNVDFAASLRMLTLETKALKQCAAKVDPNKKSVIFIDGPIVDPPNYKIKNYVERRCEAIKDLLEKDALIVGCVKRFIRSNILIKYISEKLAKDQNEKGRVNQFTSDMHLISHVFTKIFLSNETGVLFTLPIDINDENKVYKAYSDEGVKVFSTFMQKNISSYPFRLDIPFKIESSKNVNTIIEEIVKITAIWTLPGQEMPLPVQLAHSKCSIRKGCAQVLYDEIMTRSTSSDVFENIIRARLK